VGGERKRYLHGPPDIHVKYERKLAADPEHKVEVRPQICEGCHSGMDISTNVLILQEGKFFFKNAT
jgi:hypothetical protein